MKSAQFKRSIKKRRQATRRRLAILFDNLTLKTRPTIFIIPVDGSISSFKTLKAVKKRGNRATTISTSVTFLPIINAVENRFPTAFAFSPRSFNVERQLPNAPQTGVGTPNADVIASISSPSRSTITPSDATQR